MCSLTQMRQNDTLAQQYKGVLDFYSRWDPRIMEQDSVWRNLNPGTHTNTRMNIIAHAHAHAHSSK